MTTIDCKDIKILVEAHYDGLSLRAKTRQRKYSFARFVFAGLCMRYAKDFHHNEVAFQIGRHRTSVNHALKAFEDMYGEPWGREVTRSYDMVASEIEEMISKPKAPVYNRARTSSTKFKSLV